MKRSTLIVLALALASFASADPAHSRPKRPSTGVQCDSSSPWTSLWDQSPEIANQCADKVVAESNGSSRNHTDARCVGGAPACCTTSPNGVEVCVSEVTRPTSSTSPVPAPIEELQYY